MTSRRFRRPETIRASSRRRGGEQDSALPATDHAAHDVLGQLHRQANVGSTMFNSSASSVSVANAPPASLPAFNTAARSGRSASATWPIELLNSCLGGEVDLNCLHFAPSASRSEAAVVIAAVSAAMIRSNPFCAKCRASSNPMPLEDR